MNKVTRIARQRLLSLALIALLVQATLPYMIANCPVYSGVGATASASQAMPADCPMLAMHHSAAQPGKKLPQPVKDAAALTCPLCAVMSPLHAFVVAGLVALPPPAAIVAAIFVFPPAGISRLPQTASFSARAPPVLG